MHRLLARLKVRDAAMRSKQLLLEHRDEEALAFAAQAHELAAAHLGPGDVEYVLACSYLATVKFRRRDETGAMTLLESVAASANTVLAQLPEERQAVLNNLAVCHHRGGRPDKAIELMEQVVRDKAATDGELSTELLGNLNDLAAAYDDAGRFGDAEETIRHLVRILEQEPGPESREYVQGLSNLAACLRHAEKNEEAEDIERRMAELLGRIRDEQRGEVLERDAQQAYRNGDFSTARKLHRALLARTPSSPLPDFFTDVLGDVLDPLVHFAATLDKEGLQAEEARDFTTAILRYRAVVEIFRVSSDGYGIHSAQAWNNLALTHQHAGDFAAAQQGFAQAVRRLGPLLDSEQGAPIVANVVALYWALCNRDAPDPAKDLKAALALLDESAREKGEQYARSMRIRFPLRDPTEDAAEEMCKWTESRITFYLSFGAVKPARALHRHLLDLHELLFARKPVRILRPLLSSIAFHLERGPTEQTRVLLDRAIELSAEILDDAPFAAAEVLRWEARFRSTHGDQSGAAESLLSARELLRESPGTEGALEVIEDDLLIVWMRGGEKGLEVDVLLDRAIANAQRDLNIENSQAVQHLATLLTCREDFDGAEELFRQAAEKQRETVGEWDPQYALTLSNLGNLLRMRGRAVEAVPLLRQAMKVRELEFGAHHQTTAASRLRLALALGSLGQWEAALDEVQQVVQANEEFLQSLAGVTSREQLFRALRTDRSALDALISIALHLADRRRATRLIYAAILRRKGLGAEAFAARRLPQLSDRYPQQRAALAELDEVSRILSEHLASARHSHEDLAEARARKHQLEAELAAEIPEVGFQAVWRSADIDAIRDHLDETCLLLEYAQYRPFNFAGVLTDDDPEMHPSRYLGLVVGCDQEPILVDLGDVETIDASIAKFGRLLAGEAGAIRGLSFGEDGGTIGANTPLAPLRKAGEQVRAAIWDPLFPASTAAEHVLVAPDGMLGLLPFDLLPHGEENLLLDDLLISNLGSGRDVIRLAEPAACSHSPPVILAAPDFDLALDVATPPGEAQRDFVRALDRLGLTRVSPLAGAEREGREISSLLPNSRILTGAAATEQAMRELSSPLALHIATHGFSLEPSDGSDDNGDAMFHAGLVLAGANASPPGGDDGVVGDAILTGEEAATLNLPGTDLVVLSACRSGLGKSVPGEGVFGLHRAFAVAGARCVITSLWKIPDEQTTDLMVCLYKELKDGSSRAFALRAAKRQMRAQHQHPYYWGSFLCHGDWRPIPQLASRNKTGSD